MIKFIYFIVLPSGESRLIVMVTSEIKRQSDKTILVQLDFDTLEGCKSTRCHTGRSFTVNH